MKPTITADHSKRRFFVSQKLFKAPFVFIRDDTVRPSLKQPYDGPFKVLETHEKYFIVERKGTQQKIAVDRLKPAFVADEAEIKLPNNDDWLIPLMTSVTPVRTAPAPPRTEPPMENQQPESTRRERRVQFAVPSASRIPRRSRATRVGQTPITQTRSGRAVVLPSRYR